MGKRVNTVKVNLDSGSITSLPEDEIKKIVRGADSIVGSGGRTILGKILKGSKDKKIFEHGLENNPAYGAFSNSTISVITQKIDWVIENGFLQIEYDKRFPLLFHTPQGWKYVIEIICDEIITKFNIMIESNVDYSRHRVIND